MVDDYLVILALDHSFIPDGRFAPLLPRDIELLRSSMEASTNCGPKPCGIINDFDVVYACGLWLVIGGLAGTPIEASVEVPQVIRERDAFD